MVKALYITLKNLFRKPITCMYPDKKREMPKRMRAPLFALTKDEDGVINCIACKLCEMICPSNVISVLPSKEKNEKGRLYPEKYELNLSACLFCEYCVQVCPNDAIVMIRTLGWATDKKENLFLTKEKLLENYEKYKDLISECTGEFLRKMQTPPRKVSGGEK
ncbi:MAG: NADH-quinone oxidoreductase subunit I [candidate division WOR-3 bacterium]|uniref:NADH-quinone oxidoreductase subunit I n=1 Tax=candidate division WOR-3 bacterium TaxID=2052148 RepID=A0A7V4EB91_UNCW3